MGQWTPMDSLACSVRQLDRTNSSGIWEARVGLWIPMDCLPVPWDSKIGQTVGFGGLRWDTRRSSTIPPVAW